MRRPDFHFVRQREQLRVDRVVQHSCHRLRREAAAAGEVRPPDVADEQRVAGEDLLRRAVLHDDPRHSFRCMSRRLDCAQLHGADAKSIALRERLVRKGSVCSAEITISAPVHSAARDAAHEIAWRWVRYVLIFRPARSLINVLIDIALRTRWRLALDPMGRRVREDPDRTVKVNVFAIIVS